MSTSLTLVKPEERQGDNNILPVVKERVLSEIEGFIKRRGYIDVPYLSEQLGLARMTVHAYVKDILQQWREHDVYSVESQVKVYEKLLGDISVELEKTAAFSDEYIRLVDLQSSTIDRINSLRRLANPELSQPQDVISFHISGRIKPKTAAAMAAAIHKEEIQPEPVATVTPTEVIIEVPKPDVGQPDTNQEPGRAGPTV